MIIMCLDYGDRFIGVALTDPEGKMALRHTVIDQGKRAAIAALRAEVEKERVDKIIVGVPLGSEGNETEQTHKTWQFMEKLRGSLGEKVAVESVNELLTSREARRKLRAEGGNLNDEHMEAARIMLSDYLRRRTDH